MQTQLLSHASAASPIGADMCLTVAQQILTQSWSLICAHSWDLIITCHSHARYCDIPLLLNDFLLTRILWDGPRNESNNPVSSVRGAWRYMPTMQTPDQLNDRYGEMARWQGSGIHGKLERPRSNVAVILEEYVRWQAFSSRLEQRIRAIPLARRP